jgi:hypothetical protein
MSDPAVDLGDSWKPASLREAEAALDKTMTASREVIKQAEEKLKSLPDVDHTARPEDIAAIKAAAERPDAPAALRELKKKVDAGALTWKDILEGRALQDETVRAMMSARLDEMREIYQEAEAGASLEEILEARGVTSGSVFDDGATGATRTYSPPPARREAYDDEAFTDPLASRGEHEPRRDTRNVPPRRPEEPDDDDYFGGSVLN